MMMIDPKIQTVTKLTANPMNFGMSGTSDFKTSSFEIPWSSGILISKMSSVTIMAITASLNASIRTVVGV